MQTARAKVKSWTVKGVGACAVSWGNLENRSENTFQMLGCGSEEDWNAGGRLHNNYSILFVLKPGIIYLHEGWIEESKESWWKTNGACFAAAGYPCKENEVHSVKKCVLHWSSSHIRREWQKQQARRSRAPDMDEAHFCWFTTEKILGWQTKQI